MKIFAGTQICASPIAVEWVILVVEACIGLLGWQKCDSAVSRPRTLLLSFTQGGQHGLAYFRTMMMDDLGGSCDARAYILRKGRQNGPWTRCEHLIYCSLS